MCVGSFYILLVDNDMFMFTTTKSNVGFCIATKFDNKHPTIVLRYFKENSYSNSQRIALVFVSWFVWDAHNNHHCLNVVYFYVN